MSSQEMLYQAEKRALGGGCISEVSLTEGSLHANIPDEVVSSTVDSLLLPITEMALTLTLYTVDKASFWRTKCVVVVFAAP